MESNKENAINFYKTAYKGNPKKAVDRATNAGAEVLAPIRLVQTNGIETKQAFLKGPDGEIIELMQIISGDF
ncbi:hypothetical protein [Lutimonas zeaxanthinifaciens]|uniref:hypothetical protein n=1 Tax=Lutimonas zeaxanthinifaciens TaxID=3060215 RepID=UPI00265CCA77|nr:hypothetical protein [Lutimonas sp. YSD2104]WKK67048.1 hypothetical protein QZH61_05350 [Lutimonas sp. YSD2104]